MLNAVQVGEVPSQAPRKQSAVVVLTALGVVYGDIGTSTRCCGMSGSLSSAPQIRSLTLTPRLCELPTSGGSRDRAKSPAIVSLKWEYSPIVPETFGGLADRNPKMGARRRMPKRECPLLAASSRGNREVGLKAQLRGWGGRDRTLQ